MELIRPRQDNLIWVLITEFWCSVQVLNLKQGNWCCGYYFYLKIVDLLINEIRTILVIIAISLIIGIVVGKHTYITTKLFMHSNVLFGSSGFEITQFLLHSRCSSWSGQFLCIAVVLIIFLDFCKSGPSCSNNHCEGFNCWGHHCIPMLWVCDSLVDCPAGDDEQFGQNCTNAPTPTSRSTKPATKPTKEPRTVPTTSTTTTATTTATTTTATTTKKRSIIYNTPYPGWDWALWVGPGRYYLQTDLKFNVHGYMHIGSDLNPTTASSIQ